MSNVNDSIIEISYNIPTTETDIDDFINVAKELERQIGAACDVLQMPT